MEISFLAQVKGKKNKKLLEIYENNKNDLCGEE
jgi:hypothetical protein